MNDPVYVYDGECALCSSFVRFLIQRERTGQLKLVTAQSETGRSIYVAEGLCPDSMETAILRVNGKTWINLALFTEGLAMCGWPWKIARVLHLLPQSIANWIYRRIANNRKLFNRGVCLVPTPEMRSRMID